MALRHHAVSARLRFGELRGLISPQDELMLEAAAVGELLVARIRLFAASLIFLMPGLAWWHGAPRIEVVNGAIFASLALLLALGLLALARRNAISPALRFASTGFDVTSVSLVLTLFLVQGYPHTALNSQVVWELYLLSIAATALRGDPRVCLFAGSLAVGQYLGVVIGAWSYGDLSDPRFAPFDYGQIRWSDQVSRLMLMVLAMVLALAAVLQTCKLLALSGRDSLTGVSNRAWLDSRLEREVRTARTEARPLCLAMLDVDRFKPFNDDHGHLAGDLVLRSVAERLRSGLDPIGLVARYGGEEFALLFPGLGIDLARQQCERVRELIAQARIDLPGLAEPIESPTVSIGVAELQVGQRAEDLLDVADRRLKRAKLGGRNRVVAEEPEPVK